MGGAPWCASLKADINEIFIYWGSLSVGEAFEICSARLSLGQWAPLCAFVQLLFPFAADFSIVGAVPQDGMPLGCALRF